MFDVTESQASEAQTQRGAGFLGAVLDTIDTGVVACGADGSLTLLNRAARELHGQAPAAELPEEWAECFDLYGPEGSTPLTPEEIPLSRALRGETVREAEMVIAPHGRPARRLVANAHEWRPGESAAEVMKRADVSLYEDKKAVREARLRDVNRVAAVRSALASFAGAELDALAAMAAQALAVPVVLVSLVNGGMREARA